MASVGGGEVKSGRKSLDAEINLVPFIDLLSMCICFLLMTAVWIQIGSLQVKQSHGTEAAAAESNSYEMDVRFSGPSGISATLKQKGKAAHKIEVSAATPEAMNAELDAKVKAWLQSVGNPTNSPVSSAMITPAAGVPYGSLVGVMDVLRKHQIVNLGVVPTKDAGGR